MYMYENIWKCMKMCENAWTCVKMHENAWKCMKMNEWMNSFWKVFFYQLGRELKEKNVQISISQKWFEISIPNFHQLLTSIGTRSVPNMKGIAHLKRLPRPWEVQNWNGHSGSIFWATPSKFGENSFPPKL